MVAPLTTAGVSDEVAQEIPMPVGPQMLEDVEEPMPARHATLRDPGTPDRIVMEQPHLTHFPSQPWCKMCVESRGHDSPHQEQSKIDAVVPQLQFDHGYMGDGDPLQIACFLVGADTFWSHPRDDGTGLQEDGHALRCRNKSQVVRDLHRHRAIRAMEQRRKPSPQDVDLLEHIWQCTKTESRLLQ